jgi:hypothetical protein
MTNKEKGILEQLRKEVRRKSHKCYNPSCNNIAIRSHIQQAEGAIRNIASVEGKIVQVEDSDYFKSSIWRFQEKGIKQKGDVLTFWGFCNKCDTELFREVESISVDYTNYRNQVLFSYRGFLSEHYKQEYNLKWYNKIFQCNQLSYQCKARYKQEYIKFLLCVKSGRYIKGLLESDLNSESKHFKFLHFQLPRIEVCTSTVYSMPQDIILNDLLLRDLASRDTFPPISCTNFINLIPTKDKLEIIIGCDVDQSLHGGIELDQVSKYDQEAKIKLISDILIRHVETWFVSTSLYNKWRSRKIDYQIIEQMEKFRPVNMKYEPVEFNMFQDFVD